MYDIFLILLIVFLVLLLSVIGFIYFIYTVLGLEWTIIIVLLVFIFIKKK